MPREPRNPLTTGSALPLLCGVALALLGALLYTGTIGHPFIWDDLPSIVEAHELEALWPLSRSCSGPPGSGQSGRPLVAFSLALNYAAGGREVAGYHALNIAAHVGAGLALFGVARRALLAAGGEAAASATPLACCIAALWLAHPLHTDALNQVIYRNETMMALFYLATLYAALRGFEGRASWRVAAVALCLAAMACKEVAVSLPLAVLAFDAFFGAGSVRAALRTRPLWYAALGATWLALAAFVASGDRGDSVGLGHAEVLGPLDYFRTQLLALPLYLRLTVLPYPLVLDRYDGEVVREWGPVLLPLLLVSGLLALSVYSLWRGRVAGLLGVAVAVILAPTSSFIPLGGEIAAEHRMVLPLAPLIALGVLLVYRLLSRLGRARRLLGPSLALLAVGGLSALTVARNADYASEVSIWQDTVRKAPRNSRAWNQLGLAHKRAGDAPEAEAAFRESIELEPRLGWAEHNLANLLLAEGRRAEAAEWFARSLELRPDPVAHFNLGSLLVLEGQRREGVAHYEAALRLQPGWKPAALRLAWVLATSPEDDLRDGERAAALAEALPPSPRALDALAAARAEQGRFAEARDLAARAAEAARLAGQARFAAEVRERSSRYAAGEPYRQP